MRDFKPFNPEKKLAQGTSRMETIRRLAKQPDGGTTSSDYGYGPGKPVGPDTGVESLQHSSNRFLDGLQQMTQKARMNSGEIREGYSNYDSSQ